MSATMATPIPPVDTGNMTKEVEVAGRRFSTDSHASSVREENANPLERVTTEKYPEGLKLVLLLLCMYLSVFLVALDRTIIATALPSITDQFHSFGDIGWYNAAFMLPVTALQLFYGRVYTFYSPKWMFLSLVGVFEVGSAVCGAAPNSIAFIWGRAIAGMGAGGIFSGAMILMIYAGPLSKRAMYMGLFGAVFGVASVAGPLLGGVFTTKVSWRWCFYINLPIGAVVLVFLYFVVDDTEPALGKLTWREKINRLDIPGTLVFIPCIVCLLLALQWGGSTYAWSDGRIIALFVLFGVLLITFIGIQIWRQESATVPPRILKKRNIAAGSFFSFCTGSSFFLVVYYLSVWFQAVKGDSAIVSGYSTLPFILSFVVASIMSGIFVNKVGYYNPPILLGAVLAPIGAGLLTLFKPTTAHPMWIGVQVLYGYGIGVGMQQTNIAAQAVLKKEDIPTGMSLVFFMQGVGGTISVCIGQNILNSKLISSLAGIDGISPSAIVNAGATNLRNILSEDQLGFVLQVYNDAIVNVFYCALGFACACIIGASLLEWKSTKAITKAPKAPAQEVDTEKQVPAKQENKEVEP